MALRSPGQGYTQSKRAKRPFRAPATTRRGGDLVAAIDVGTNAVRLELARVLPDGTVEALHAERDPIRPGEGLFRTGRISPVVISRLLSTMRRYASLCRRYGATARAVATSAFREARNRTDVVRQIRRESGLQLEVISGREEARLICLGVLQGKPPLSRSLCIDIGGGSTEVAFAYGEHPKELWSVDVGAVRLTELFGLREATPKRRVKMVRQYIAEMFHESVPTRIPRMPPTALGSSGTIQAVVEFARDDNRGEVTAADIAKAASTLAAMSLEERSRRFDPRRAEVVVAGALILDVLMKHVGLRAVTAVDRGLREGILVDLVRRRGSKKDWSLAEAAVGLGRRLNFHERHGRHVAYLATRLFDELRTLHALPKEVRLYLETAALLHDIGHAVNPERHHKHSHYLIQNADLPTLNAQERNVVACIARFHRRTPAERGHELLRDLSPTEVKWVRRASALLRVADSLDRGHEQVVQDVVPRIGRSAVTLRLRAVAPADLEMWDAEREQEVFHAVFGRHLLVHELRRTSTRSPTPRGRQSPSPPQPRVVTPERSPVG